MYFKFSPPVKEPDTANIMFGLELRDLNFYKIPFLEPVLKNQEGLEELTLNGVVYYSNHDQLIGDTQFKAGITLAGSLVSDGTPKFLVEMNRALGNLFTIDVASGQVMAWFPIEEGEIKDFSISAGITGNART